MSEYLSITQNEKMTRGLTFSIRPIMRMVPKQLNLTIQVDGAGENQYYQISEIRLYK